MNKKILLLEDDRILAQTLHELLSTQGYEVHVVSNGNDAADVTYDNTFDLYIFDINLPDTNGLEFFKSLRNAQDTTPTIFISALLDVTSITKAFELGAEDYIKKPFFPEELLIRIKAKLFKQPPTLVYNNIELDTRTNRLKINGKNISIGDVQERLLKVFLENRGAVLDQSILLECLEKPSPAALRVALTKLKHTTGMEIKNLRGIGYILE